MKENAGFKAVVIKEFIKRKEELLAELRHDQQTQMEDAQNDDIDLTNAPDSPKEQIMEEVIRKTASIDLLSTELAALKSLNATATSTQIDTGSLVHTNKGYFLIGTPQPEFEFDGKKFIGLSEKAPVYAMMKDQKKGASFKFGKTDFSIVEVY